MYSRAASIIACSLLIGGLATPAKAQMASVWAGGGTSSFDIYSHRWLYSLEQVNMLSGDTLEIPPGAIMPGYGGIGRYAVLQIETSNGNPPSFPPPGIFGLRFKLKDGTVMVGEDGEPLEIFPTINGSPAAVAYWSVGLAIQTIPDEDFTMELVGQSGSVVSRLNIAPKMCEGCEIGRCESDPSLRSVHFDIPIGLSDVEDSREAGMVTLKFDQEELAFAGPECLSLVAPESSSVIRTNDPIGRIQSVRVGQQLAQVQQVPGETPEDLMDLQITVSSDWQSPATTVIRTVTVRNQVDEDENAYLEFDELFGGIHSITSYKKTAGGDWIMETGDGLRREIRSESETATVRTVRVKVEERIAPAEGSSPAEYAVVSDTTSVSNLFPWGWQDVENVVGDPAGSHLTTTTSYYGTGEDSSLDLSNATEGYGRVKQVILPTGQIEKHYYFTPASGPYETVHVVKRAFAGTQEDRETTTESLSGVDPGTGMALTVSRVTERAAGQIISRRMTSQEPRAGGIFSEERTYSSDSAYTSTYRFRTNDGTETVVNPDGTASVSSQVISGVTGYTTSTQISGYVTNDPSTAVPQIQPVSSSETLTDKYGEEIVSSSYLHKGGVEVLAARKVATNFDSSHRATRFEHFVEGNDDPVFVTEKEYGCCGLMRERDQEGVDTFYGYDALKRQVLTNRNGVTTQTVHAGLAVSTHRYDQVVPSGGFVSLPGSAAPANEVSRTVVNLLGDTTEQWNRSAQDGSLVKTTTGTSYNIGGGIGRRIITLPPEVTDDGATAPSQTEDFFLDGRPASRTGNLGPNRGYRYSANATGSSVESFLVDGATEKESTINQSDWARRETSVTYSSDQDGVGGNDHSDSFYNAKGQLSMTVDPDGVAVLHGYNQMGEQIYTALDLNGNGVIDLAADRVSFSETDLATRPGGEWVIRTTSKKWLDAGSDQGTSISYEDVSLDGLRNWSVLNPSVQGEETKSVTTLVSPGTHSQVILHPDHTSQTTTHVYGLVTSVTEKDADGTVLYQIDNGFDSLKRPHTQTDSRSGTTTWYYVSTTTDVVNRIVDSQNRETLVTFDHRGRQKSTERPETADEDGNPVENVSMTHHYPDGRTQEQTGDNKYRTSWTYDYAGRAATMTTYGTATAVTRWVYDSSRGFLTGKRYNSPTLGSGSGPSFTYTPGGRMKTRTQARLVGGNPVVTTYGYGTASGSSVEDLDQVSHSDGSPGFSITSRDRLGREKIRQDAAGSRTFDYSRHGAIEAETVTSGILAGQTMERGFDSILRTRSHSVSFGAHSLGVTAYGYGPSGEVRTVSGNGQSANYYQHAAKRVLERVTYTKAGETAPWLESTRNHDAGNRLTRITTHVNDAGVMKAVDHHAYGYDELDRISSHTDMTGAAWTYGYNARGEVGKAVKNLPGSSTEVNGRSYRYQFDGIGNRTLVEQSRDSGQTVRSYGYTPDALNQYAATTHPSFVDLAGTAAPAAPVTVNSQTVTRQTGYFRKELSGDNSADPQWIAAQVTVGVTTTDGSLALPAASITPVYDEDGNLKFDGLWNYTWDAENRLVRCERAAALVSAGAPYLKLEYDYDSQGRRIRTSTFTSSGASSPSTRTLFIYDGWKCVAELDALAANQPVRKYTWGLDLVGDIGDASTGNVGALLWLVDIATNKTHVHLFDRNGNVSGLVDATSRESSATYDYDAFGQLTVCYGDYAKRNPFGFSTKHTEFATGLCYYGYRWYSPMHGRWISRDPIGEEGGFNLFAMANNSMISSLDVLGLSPKEYSLEFTINKGDSMVTRVMEGVMGTAKSVSNINDVATIVQGVVGDDCKEKCVKKITIWTHGTPGTIEIGIAGQAINTGVIDLYNRHQDWLKTNPNPEVVKKQEEILQNSLSIMRTLESLRSRLCANPQIIINSCNAGHGSGGKDLEDRLTKFFGATVDLPAAFCAPTYITGIKYTDSLGALFDGTATDREGRPLDPSKPVKVDRCCKKSLW